MRLWKLCTSAAMLHFLPLIWVLVAFAQPAPSDPRAVEIAHRVMESLGGGQRWEALPGIRWSFGSERGDTVLSIRRHAWNKHTGWHRVEGKNPKGQFYCLIHNIHDGQGKAWVEGVPIEGDSLAKLMDLANAIWINDTYWMLMPYKLRDPGVTLNYEGEVAEGGRTYDKLALSFQNVGRTPGDRYWVFVNRANGRVEKWEMVLEGRQPPPVQWTWEGWEEHGGLWFPTAHRQGDRNTFTREIEAMTVFSPGEFESP